MKRRESLVERWVQGEGRLGGLPPRPVDADLVDREHFRASICWRCGASAWKGAPLSGCTEKRGTGFPWRHEFYSPVQDDPFRVPYDAAYESEWRRMTLAELVDLAHYLGMKAQGSLAAAIAWTELRDNGTDTDRAVQYAIALYREKAEKRTHLLGFVLNVIDRRVAAGETIPSPEPDEPEPEKGEDDGPLEDPE